LLPLSGSECLSPLSERLREKRERKMLKDEREVIFEFLWIFL